MSRCVFETEEREPPAAVERTDDSRRKPAEPAAAVVEKNRAGHVGNGTPPTGFSPAHAQPMTAWIRRASVTSPWASAPESDLPA